MPNYNNCVIYTIRSGEGLYVGSSCNFVQRKYQHKSVLNNKNSKNYNLKLYRVIRENDSQWDMQPYLQFPCKTKIEMSIEEERVRKELKADLNSQSCFRTEEEYLKNQKDYYFNNRDKICDQKKDYYINNKDKISDKHKNYYKNNKDEISDQRKDYYKNNKDKIADKQKNYNIKNKEKLTEKFSCACGGKYQHRNKSHHDKTASHIKYTRDKELKK